MKNMIVVYYSWSNGNTERIAKMLQAETGAELLRIETEIPYSGTYDEIVAQGKREAEHGIRPKLRPLPADLGDYDVVAVGTPTWWYTMAPAMLSFLKSQSWKGKTVIPFMTHAGWPGHVISDIKAACEGANFAPSMEVQFDSDGGDVMKTPMQDVRGWMADVRKSLQSDA